MSATRRLFTIADWRTPITSTAVANSTTNAAGTFKIAPVAKRPVWEQPSRPASHHPNGADVKRCGSASPCPASRLVKYPDQPTPTVAELTPYSRTRFQPMIQPMSSPIVARAYV